MILTREQILATPDAPPGERLADLMPERLAAELAADPEFQRVLRVFMGYEDPPGGRPSIFSELLIVASTFLPEARRLEVAQRLQARPGAPIHARKAPLVRPALERAAQAAGRSLARELEARALAALVDGCGYIVAEIQAGDPAGQLGASSPRWLPILRRVIARRLEADLMGGPDWRAWGRLAEGLSGGEAAPDPRPDEHLAAAALLAAIQAAVRPGRESEALAAILAGADSPEALAEVLETSRNNADQILHRLRKRIAGAV